MTQHDDDLRLCDGTTPYDEWTLLPAAALVVAVLVLVASCFFPAGWFQ